MLFSFSGSQGCGKTTLINKISEKYNIPVIGRKTARSILNDWNISLEEIYNDLELLCDFQTEVLNRKQLDEQESILSNEIIITERSYMDLFAYATVYFGGYQKYSDWLNDYYEQCKVLQSNYTQTIYIDRGNVPLVSDGLRPHNQYYADLIDRYMRFLLDNNEFRHVTFKNGVNMDLTDCVYDLIKNSSEIYG